MIRNHAAFAPNNWHGITPAPNSSLSTRCTCSMVPALPRCHSINRGGRELAAIAHHRVVPSRDAREELGLPRGEPQGDVAQWLGLLGPHAGRELHLGQVDPFVRALFQLLPRALRLALADRAELLAHVGADGEADLLAH